MATTIHSIAYKVFMDTRELNAGAVATKREMAAGQKVVDAHKTSIQKLEDELKRLASLHVKGAMDQAVYTAETNRLITAEKQRIVEQKKLAQAINISANADSVAAIFAQEDAAATAAATAATKAKTAAEKAAKEQLEQGKRITDSHKTALQKLKEELRRIESLYKNGALTQSVYRKEVSRLTNEYNKTNSALGKFKTGLAGIVNIKNAVVGALSAIGASRIAESIHKNIEQMDRFVKLGRRFSMETADIVRLTHIATKDTALTDEQVGKAIYELSKAIAQAKGGTESAIKIFDNLGLSVEAISSAKGLERLYLVADAFKKIKDENKQLLIASELFGKSGQELVDVVRNGSEDMRSMAEDADRMNKTWSGIDDNAIEEAADKWKEASDSWQATQRLFALNITPQLVAFLKQIEAFTKFINDILVFNNNIAKIQSGELRPQPNMILGEFNRFKKEYTGDTNATATEDEIDRIIRGPTYPAQARIGNEILKAYKDERDAHEAALAAPPDPNKIGVSGSFLRAFAEKLKIDKTYEESHGEQFSFFKRRYTGEGRMTDAERNRMYGPDGKNTEAQQVEALNEILKEMRKANGIAEANMFSVDRSKKELN